MTEVSAPDVEAIRSEANAIIEDRDGPYWDGNHLRHDAEVAKYTSLMSQLHGDNERTPDLENTMSEAMEPVGSPEGYSFENYAVQDGESWDDTTEVMFRDFFHAAELSQPEADQLMMIASSGERPDAQRTEDVLKDRYRGDDEQMASDIELAKAALFKVGGHPLMQYLNDSGLGDSIQVFDLALRKGREFMEKQNGNR
jgi:hypothetical protein